MADEMASGDRDGNGSLPEAAPTLARFFATPAFRRFLLELGREADRFRSLNLIGRENRRAKELLEKEEHLHAFLRQRALGLAALRYLLWEGGELNRDEAGRATPEAIVDEAVDSDLLELELADHLAAVFESDVFAFDPGESPFWRVERLEADERLQTAATRAQRQLETSIGDAFDELRES